MSSTRLKVRSVVLVGVSVMLLPLIAFHGEPARSAEQSSEESGKAARGAIHTDRTFEFTVKLPMKRAAPLFGADIERRWAQGWNPRFLWPAVPKDQEGVVFTIARDRKRAVWIAPAYDKASGFFQYVYVLPDTVVTLITLKLTPQDKWTHVVVRYERTALNAAAGETVLNMAEQDSQSGPEWEKQIDDYLASSQK